MRARLLAVAVRVRGEVVADVGSDHGLLPAYLLRRGLARHVIVVEKHIGPYRRCRQALEGLSATVLLGDGLEPLPPVDCLVMSGFGARAMRGILTRHPSRWPRLIVAQPNHSPEVLSELGFVLEEWVGRYPILCWTA